MTAPRRFNVTYDVVTPESAAEGDTAESGFLDARETRHDMAGIWGQPAGEVKRNTAMRLRDAVAVFGRDYGHGLQDSGSGSLYAPDAMTDYRTGDATSLAFHFPDNVTPASWERVRRILRGSRA